MADNYNPASTDWTRPVQGAISITAGASHLQNADGENITIRGLYIGGTGDVTVTHPDESSKKYVGLASGMIHPIAATHVTVATATDILGVY